MLEFEIKVLHLYSATSTLINKSAFTHSQIFFDKNICDHVTIIQEYFDLFNDVTTGNHNRKN